MAVRIEYEAVIGLEVHVQLLTKSKIFCPCPNLFGEPPNTLVCPVCLGMPGTLPVLNEEAVNLAIRAGLALRGDVQTTSIFARKNYFYPDLPKGYQISQFDRPICLSGSVPLPGGGSVALSRIHLEEDAGKSIHPGGDADHSLVDLNRCGVPLIEIVSTPSISTPEEAHDYLTSLRQILLYAALSDCNMEEGSLRCDANISLRPAGSDSMGSRTELKNLNSFRAVQGALLSEFDRQEGLLRRGRRVLSETLLWDAANQCAVPMRSKEEAHDYRYFPEPDLPPLRLSPDRIETIRAALPELPAARRERFRMEYGLREYDAAVLTGSIDVADYFEEILLTMPDAGAAARFMTGKFLRTIKEKGGEARSVPVRPRDTAELLLLAEEGTISASTAKELFDIMWETGRSAAVLIDERGLRQISGESELLEMLEEVLDRNGPQVLEFHQGKEQILGYFVGIVMEKTAGKANPQVLIPLLRAALARRGGGGGESP